MTAAELEKLIRREIGDDIGSDTQKLINSSQMLAYLNEAENEACRRARLLIDSATTAICQIPVVAGSAVYDFDPRIIFIRRATVATGLLRRISSNLLDEKSIDWESHQGIVTNLVSGLYSQRLQLYKVPTADDTLKLTVVRTPLKPLTTGSDNPEIPERLHKPLINWVRYKVYSVDDSELYDSRKALLALAKFEEYFGKRPAYDDVLDEMPEVRQLDGTDSDGGGYF